jgi:hypothetical protein
MLNEFDQNTIANRTAAIGSIYNRLPANKDSIGSAQADCRRANLLRAPVVGVSKRLGLKNGTKPSVFASFELTIGLKKVRVEPR